MRILIDTDAKTLNVIENSQNVCYDLYSTEAFETLSEYWLKLGWNQKYTYTFTWLGRPIIQLPEDMFRIQEVIYHLKPDVMIETGVAHGGSLIFYAGLCQLMQHGRVIGIDIEIRPHNRTAIEVHPLHPLITLIEGNSVDEDIVERVKSHIRPDESVLVILDSCHTKEHVLQELETYHSMVTLGSYIIATDGIMQQLYDMPRGNPDWQLDNPMAAAIEFSQTHPEFEIVQPEWLFNESSLTKNITHWPMAWLRRK